MSPARTLPSWAARLSARLIPAALLCLGLTGQSALACAPDQGRVQAGSVCLVLQVIAAPAGPGRALAILVHGDGSGFVEPAYLKLLEKLGQRLADARPGDGVIFVQRPGYRSPLGRSEGRAKAGDDDYTAENVTHMAAAARALREHFGASRLVWVGHSGGAALGALALGRERGVAEGAVLAGCPCGNIAEWRLHRNATRGRVGTWPHSLSPVDHMDALMPGLSAVLLTGERDENTLARFNEPWIEKARQRGVDARMLVLPGLGHGGVLESTELIEQAARLMKHTP